MHETPAGEPGSTRRMGEHPVRQVGNADAASGSPGHDTTTGNHLEPWVVACLCARWCGTCGEYESVFDSIAQARPGHVFAWVDIEDDADTVGDVDVENFPTLLIMRNAQVVFFGVLLPYASHLSRLLDSLAASAASPVVVDESVAEFAFGLWGRVHPALPP